MTNLFFQNRNQFDYINVSGTLTASNIQVRGSYNQIDSIIQNTSNLLIDNSYGFDPSLIIKHNSINGNTIIADIYGKDTNNPILRISDKILEINSDISLGNSGNQLSLLGCKNPIYLAISISDEYSKITEKNTITLYAPHNITIRSTKKPKFTLNIPSGNNNFIEFDILINDNSIYNIKPNITNNNVISVSGQLNNDIITIKEDDKITVKVLSCNTDLARGAKVYIYST